MKGEIAPTGITRDHGKALRKCRDLFTWRIVIEVVAVNRLVVACSEKAFQHSVERACGLLCHKPPKFQKRSQVDLHSHASLLRNEGESAIIVLEV